jgi:hypothetical protein
MNCSYPGRFIYWTYIIQGLGINTVPGYSVRDEAPSAVQWFSRSSQPMELIFVNANSACVVFVKANYIEIIKINLKRLF